MILRSDRLWVEIADAGIYPNVGTRFDRAGFIKYVVLDNAYQFCTEEPHNLRHEWSGGAGICNEFVFDPVSVECPVGEWFPKFGVGLLKKETDTVFKGYIRYQCQPFEQEVIKENEACVEFITHPKTCRGYAALTRRKIRVEDNRILMDISLKNVGERSIDFEELCHNFQTIEHLPIGPEYDLRMDVAPQDQKEALRGTALYGKGKGFAFSGYSDQPSMYRLEKEDIDRKAPFTWKLTHQKSPVSVSETVSVTPQRITVWTIDHIVCPEAICRFIVEPGEEVCFSRIWCYEDERRMQ